MDANQAQQKSKKQSQWVTLDPFSLVRAAESSFYELDQSEREKIEGPIGEVLRRFEQQSRATLGSTVIPTSK